MLNQFIEREEGDDDMGWVWRNNINEGIKNRENDCLRHENIVQLEYYQSQRTCVGWKWQIWRNLSDYFKFGYLPKTITKFKISKGSEEDKWKNWIEHQSEKRKTFLIFNSLTHSLTYILAWAYSGFCGTISAILW